MWAIWGPLGGTVDPGEARNPWLTEVTGQRGRVTRKVEADGKRPCRPLCPGGCLSGFWVRLPSIFIAPLNCGFSSVLTAARSAPGPSGVSPPHSQHRPRLPSSSLSCCSSCGRCLSLSRRRCSVSPQLFRRDCSVHAVDWAPACRRGVWGLPMLPGWTRDLEELFLTY